MRSSYFLLRSFSPSVFRVAFLTVNERMDIIQYSPLTGFVSNEFFVLNRASRLTRILYAIMNSVNAAHLRAFSYLNDSHTIPSLTRSICEILPGECG